MDDLLKYYEQELSFLRRYGREFAERYPKIAGRLQMSGETCEDPHIERMIESFALLTARIGKKLEDDYPQLTESLFEVLYPHYLRPFPACSIAQFDPGSNLAQMTSPYVIPRGTEMMTRPIKNIPCRFRSAFDVTLVPLKLRWARYEPAVRAPSGTTLPTQATGCIALQFEVIGEQFDLANSGLNRLRVHLDGEASFTAALHDALFLQTGAAYLELGQHLPWQRLAHPVIRAVGFDECEALIELPARSHPAYRLLTEYFAFPEKFSFFDIELGELCSVLPRGQIKSFTLHLVLNEFRADSNQGRLLANLNASKLKLFCTPVINLFHQRGEPIRMTHTEASYPVVADARRAYAFEVYSIDSVKLVRQDAQGESVTEFKPFYSLRHGEDPLRGANYWFAHRDDGMAERSPGFETEISIVDLNFNPAAPQNDTLSLELTCTNRDLPSAIAYGLPGGDLFIEGGTLAREIRLLRKPTPAYHFERGRGAQWRLISHLSLNHLSLVKSGLSAFKEMLCLYDLPRSSISGRQINSIQDLQYSNATAWLPGKPFANFVRGIEIIVSIDEDNFAGASIDIFARVLDHFFGLYVQVNSFTRLAIKSSQTQQEIVRCEARSGESHLV
jgi:type VI secretion system protein ImpG